MKSKIITTMALSLCLALGACSSDDIIKTDPVTGSESAVTFDVKIPKSIKSRAFGDGSTAAANVKYYVYDQDFGASADPVLTGDVNVDTGALTGTLTLQLATGHVYDIVFLAEASEAYSYDDAARQLKVDYDKVSTSSESLDAFYGTVKDLRIDGQSAKDVTLVRPFAQLNIGTNDLAEYQSTFNKTLDKISLKVTGLYSAFDLMNDEVTGETVDAVTFAAAALPEGETFPVTYNNGEDDVAYDYLAMDYLLVNSQKQLVDVDMTVYDSDNTNTTLQYENIPVQRNFRTNIYGGLLLSSTDFNVTLAPGFNEPDYDFPVVTTVESLYAAITDAGGAVIPESVSISLDELLPSEGYSLTLDGDTELVVNGEITCDTGAQIHVGGTMTRASEGAVLKISGGGIISSSVRGLFYLDDGGSIDMKDVTIVTTSYTRGSAIYVVGGESINLENVTFDAGRAAIFIEYSKDYTGDDGDFNTTNVKVSLKDCIVDAKASALLYSNPAYAFCFYSGKVTLDNITLSGVHGGVAACGDAEVTINSGTYVVHNNEGKNDAYGALWANEASVLTVNGGSFSSPRKNYSAFCTYELLEGYNEYEGTVNLYGGKFADKPYDWIADTDMTLPEGYSYAESGDEDFPWTIVKN
jgi:hypothetical protein